MNVTLIIPTYRNPKYLDLCLKSAIENRDDSNNHILVIVDGYFEESRTVLEKYPDVLYLDLGQNRGMQYALNAGVMQSHTEYVCIINDDNVMCRNWDTRMLAEIKEQNKYGIPYALTIDQFEPIGPSMFNFPTMNLGKTAETFQYENWLANEFDHQEDKMELDGHIFPFVMEKKYYLSCGGFDTFYNSPNWCDVDFFLKLELLGFKFPRTRKLRLYHFGSISTKKNAEAQKFREREQNALEEFRWKWGYVPNIINNAQSHFNSKLPYDGQKLRGIKTTFEPRMERSDY